MAEYGERPLRRGDEGPDVVELQMRLAGFRGTIPDGEFGPGTELQVMAFQRDWMKLPTPTGHVDESTYDAMDEFAADHTIDFKALACDCKICDGFGRGQFKGEYVSDRPRVEAHHRYEYPGVHRMILWAYRAAIFYCRKKGLGIEITSGYRCSENNRLKGRTSTNHHGKAIDFDVTGITDKRVDADLCEQIRGSLVETANAQIGWGASNRKSLEAKDLAPTWVHYDVRSYEQRYLEDRYFVRAPDELDGRRPMLIA